MNISMVHLPMPCIGSSAASISISDIRLNRRTGRSPLFITSASSNNERALLDEHPAALNFALDRRPIAVGSRRPPASSATRELIVSAALVESCWERIDLANDSKLLDLGRTVPIGQGPHCATTVAKRRSKEEIRRPIARERASVMTIWGRYQSISEN